MNLYGRDGCQQRSPSSIAILVATDTSVGGFCRRKLGTEAKLAVQLFLNSTANVNLCVSVYILRHSICAFNE